MRNFLMGALMIVLGGCSTVPTSFTPSDPLPPEQVSHRLWQEILSADVRDGAVDYPAVFTAGAAWRRLSAYRSDGSDRSGVGHRRTRRLKPVQDAFAWRAD